MAEQKLTATFQDKEVQEFFRNMKARLSNIENGQAKFVGLISSVVYRDVIGHFQEERGSQGPWEKWSPSYQTYMENINRAGNQILQFSGKLRQNFKPTNNRITSEGFLWFNDAQTKTEFPYAALHDEGGPNHPKRDFMWLSDKAAEDISKITLQFLLDEGV